ncbi:hypothetical protein KFE69_05340 [bacterium SCSIO 12844]|nr:hypothetical protein KFE69_05340 [bacterium SCSIO 12844]
MKNLFKFIIIFLFMSNFVYAETFVSGRIINKSAFPIVVSKVSSNCWYDNEDTFQNDFVIFSNESKDYRTQDKRSGDCYNDGVAIQKTHFLKIKITDIFGNSSIVRLSTYVTSGWKGHCYDPQVDGSGILITSNDKCNYDLSISLLTSVHGIGVGKIYTSSYNPQKTKITFSSTNTACYAELTDSMEIRDIYCDSHNIDSRVVKNKVVFFCQQHTNSDSSCPWAFSQKKAVNTSPVKFL